jgi:molybdopterin-containing oxidoreductase family iron-sulfur binding subunit
MPRYGMVIDLDRCMGCRACMEACKVENNTPEGAFWMHVFRFEEGEYPDAKIGFLPRPCQHCDNAPCVKVCPVQARHKQEDGLVLTDYKRCIGCRYCIIACPYGVNHFNWRPPEDAYYLDWDDASVEKVTGGAVPPYDNPDLDQPHGDRGTLVAGGGHYQGTTEKCTFCVQRLEKDLLPACVANCPVSVFSFGDLDDPNSAPSEALKSKRAFRLKEELNTEPKVYYIGQPPPDEDIRPIEIVSSTGGE